ncbi:hypothetical protein DIC66_05400 [Rhodoferax lacus]|uniref:histidine kinase n=1 Tax=Rhodoferax lacus TaxID=2184758 RepID=A0A3E1RGJ6_9BURK|nr:ATP-binding protein [Rhodoferax lacus]RFO98152.1 hypothetical protein DIC66_05400 [Rhodoferax lacus]
MRKFPLGDLESRHHTVLILLWTATVLLCLLTCAHVYGLVTEGRQREIQSAERDLSNLTRLSQEHAVRTFRSADQVIRFVQSRYQDLGSRLDLAALTRQGVIDAEIFNQIGIIDAKGIYTLSSLPIATHPDLSDREHFKVHVHQDSGQLYVSKPVIGRASGKQSIQLTRRINNSDGSFGGVVVLSIDPTYFTNFYGELNLGPGGLTALYGQDGIARARRVGDKTEFGTDASRSILFAQRIHEKPFGSYIQHSVVDDVERLFYYRTMPKTDMVVMAGVDMRFLMANQEQAAQALYLQAGLVSLLILALAGGLSRYLWLLRRDANARLQAQAQIRERKEQLDAVFDLSPDGFVSFDRNQCVKFVNPAFRHLTGLGALTLEGMEARDFSAWLAEQCETSARFGGLSAMRRKAESNPANAVETIELKDSGQRTLMLQLRLSDTGTISQLLHVRDITKEIEVEVLKSEFLATAAHELRTPMASIFGFSEVLLTQDVDTESRQEFLGIIHKQSRLMVDILNELLDLARIEARRGKDFKYLPINLQTMLTDMAKSFQCPAGRAQPELEMPAQAITLLADAGKLRQALLNLLSNAYKYSPEGGAVRIEVERLSDKDTTPRVAIRISDHGIGMTPEQCSKVFARFYRADTSGRLPGTGLGMSIAKEIVEHHHGSISIISAPGEGSQFTIVLPEEARSHESGKLSDHA